MVKQRKWLTILVKVLSFPLLLWWPQPEHKEDHRRNGKPEAR